MHVSHRSRAGSKGYVLLGALALSVIVAVAASKALLSSQHKLDEANAKQANVEARLAMDSQASRILTRVDRNLESVGIYQTDDILRVPTGDTVSGAFKVTKISPDSGVNLDPYNLYPTPLLFHRNDPMFPDVRMQVRQFNVGVSSDSTKSGLPNYDSHYTFQVRALAITDFAVFNPGEQTESITLGSDGLLADSNGQRQGNPWVYVGALRRTASYATSQGASATKVLTAVSYANDPSARLYRRSSVGPANAAVQIGAAKTANAASSGFASMRGDYNNYDFSGSYGDLNQLFETLGSQNRNPINAVNPDTCDPVSTYESVATYMNNGPLLAPYTFTTVTCGNPLYLPSNNSEVAILDLGSILHGSAGSMPEWSINLGVPKDANGMPVSVIVVTNSGFIPVAHNVTFPPNLNVFFADPVNTNGARLRLEGNIGFLPVMDASVFVVDTGTLNNRIVVSPFADQQSPKTVDRPAIAVDTTAQAFIYTYEYKQLERELGDWADSVQTSLLANPGTPYYTPNLGAGSGYFQIKVFKLNESCKPVVSVLQDVATNISLTVYTNEFRDYAFAGDTTADCSVDYHYWFLGADSMRDASMPEIAKPDVPPGRVLSETTTSTGTEEVKPHFSIPYLEQLHRKLTPVITDQYHDNATLTTWTPANVPQAQLLAQIDPTGDPLKSEYFAIAWMEILPGPDNGAYDESYLEDYKIGQKIDKTDSGSTPDTTTTLTDFDPVHDMHPIETQTPWYNYLQDHWLADHSQEPNLVTPPFPTFRYTSAGVPNSLTGAWRRKTVSVTKDSYNFDTLETKLTENTLDPKDPAIQAAFFKRQVVFHYLTLGWAIPNLVIAQGPAPDFYGRLVVEDGIKQLSVWQATNFVVHGQVTYSQKIHPNPDTISMNMPAYGVFHASQFYPVSCAERLYDVRISRVDTHRR